MSKRPRKDDTISRQIKKRITEREIDQNCDMKLKSIHGNKGEGYVVEFVLITYCRRENSSNAVCGGARLNKRC